MEKLHELIIRGNDKNEVPIRAVFSNNNSNNGDQIRSAEETEAYISSFPPGFRFYPTDCEVVTHYLKRKLDNLPLHPNKIYEINIYKYNPDTIAAHVKPTTEEKVWYILTPRDRKYPNGTRPSRSAGDGYWKATGADKQIMDRENMTLIGLKKTLVFYIGTAPKGEKTNWIMHEYRVPATPNIPKRDANDRTLDEWVLCKIYNNSDTNNTMFTQRKRSRQVLDTYDGQQLDESCNENHDHPQRFSNFPQSSSSTFCNMPWSTCTSAYNYQSCVPQFNPINDYCAPSPMMIEPISSINSSIIGHDQTMKTEGFGIPNCFTCCIGGQECYGDQYLGHEKLSNNSDVQCDSMDCVDQYLVNNYEMNMYLPEYNKENLINGETSKSKVDS